MNTIILRMALALLLRDERCPANVHERQQLWLLLLDKPHWSSTDVTSVGGLVLDWYRRLYPQILQSITQALSNEHRNKKDMSTPSILASYIPKVEKKE